MKPRLKPPETKRLKLKWDIMLSTSAFKSNLRRYTKVEKALWALKAEPKLESKVEVAPELAAKGPKAASKAGAKGPKAAPAAAAALASAAAAAAAADFWAGA